MKTELFDFHLPPDRIATHPVTPRDASRLLVVPPHGPFLDRSVQELTDYLMPGDLMVFNDTKVIPARLTGKRGEATVSITLHKYLGEEEWEAFAKPAKRLKQGDIIIFNNDISAKVEYKNENGTIRLIWNNRNWREYIDKYGSIPLPPYMKRTEEASDKASYQTVYAQKEGAVASPTAGLHFTERIFQSIDNKGIKRCFLTLHVGGGTFLPIKAEDTDAHVMHTEYYEISEQSAADINLTRRAGGRVVAIGTTALRAIESAADESGVVRPCQGETGIFIAPGYRFKAVDALMTNFHLPKSTLFVLVSAFAGLERMQAAYRHAVEENYRFYSYGDACLLFRS